VNGPPGKERAGPATGRPHNITDKASVTAYERLIDALGDQLGPVNGVKARARCPAHDGVSNTSLAITAIEGRILVHCHAGCDTVDVLAALDLTWADLFDNPNGAVYRYDNGRTVHRTPDKKFRQGNTSEPPELYRLGKVRAAVAAGRTVYVAEGENDVHALEAIGVTATCNPMGAGKWSKVDASPLHGAAKVVIIADRDKKGAQHASDIWTSLKGHVGKLEVVQARRGKDAADHIAAGLDADDFLPVPVPPPIGEERGTPLYVDVASLLDGGLPEPPAPAFLHRDDGRALLYAGQVNVLFGDPESGKTWVAIAAVAEALQARGRALFLDLDHNGVEAILARLLAFGVRPDVLRDPGVFRLAEPEDEEHLRRIIADARRWRPALAVVDSVGELLPMLGLSSNSPDDLTAGHAQVLKPLAVAGACVVAIDHLPKNTENKAAGQTGTAAKRRVVGGVSLRVTVKDAFTPGHGGACSLKVNKDRHGGLRAHCPRTSGEAFAGTFALSQVPGGLSWQITAPGDHMEPDADAIALRALKPPPQSVRDIKARMGWGSDRATAGLSAFREAFRIPTSIGEEQVHASVPVPAERSGTPEHDWPDDWHLRIVEPEPLDYEEDTA
jgi:5S rRNA maturation endonuclease (ribonuclease M5)